MPNEIAKFFGTISTMGEEVRVIVIPKKLHADLKKHVGKQVKITLEEL